MSLFSVHLGYVLGLLPFADRFAYARKLGFRAVEFPFPYATPADDYAALLRRHSLQQISIGAPTGDYRKGEPGFAVDYRQRDSFVRALEQAVAYAKRISCPAVHIFSGCGSSDLSTDDMEETYCGNLAEAADLLAKEGITTLIEPINSKDFPGYYLDSLNQASKLIAKIGSANIRLIFDVYHLRAMGEDPLKSLADIHQQVQHIQFADFPGRHEPGSGTLDFAAIVRVMRSTGYTGSAGLEYIPTRPPSEPLALPQELADYADLTGVLS